MSNFSLNYCRQLLNQYSFFENAYFTDLKSAIMTKEGFIQSQEQFCFAVDFFSRPMAALMARIDCPQQRCVILSNILEEHGNFNPNKFHANTFDSFLQSLGSQSSNRASKPGPEVQKFNATLYSSKESS